MFFRWDIMRLTFHEDLFTEFSAAIAELWAIDDEDHPGSG